MLLPQYGSHVGGCVGWKRSAKLYSAISMAQPVHVRAHTQFMCRLLEERTTPNRQGWSDSKMLLTANSSDADSPPSNLTTFLRPQPGNDQLASVCLRYMHDIDVTHLEQIWRLSARHLFDKRVVLESEQEVNCADCQHAHSQNKRFGS